KTSGRNGNTVLENSYFDSAANCVERYIDSSPQFNKEAFAELYFIKSLVLSEQAFDAELDSLKIKYPTQEDLFEALKQTYSQAYQ
ncbi:MAG: hypothetical protein ACJ749_17570, partial [Flavisolibacter sp.]